jgi:hypothetical protein
MKKFSDNDIRGKILRKLAAHKLASESIITFPDTETFLLTSVCADPFLVDGDFGSPIIAITCSAEFWTVVTCDYLLSKNNHGVNSIKIDDIASFEPVFDADGKGTLQIVEIASKDGTKSHFWAPPGMVFGALCSILRMLLVLNL